MADNSADVKSDFNYANFTLQNIGGATIKAVAAFIYKGYIISMSNIMRNPSVIVFIEGINTTEYEARSVEDAIAWVDKNA